VTSRTADGQEFFADASSALSTKASGDAPVRRICALAPMLAAGLHIGVGLEHAGSNFGALAFAAGVAQGLLSAVVLLRNSALAPQAVLLINLMLIQLYLVNVTVGLPPQIAHTHLGGNHQVGIFTLAWPGVVDFQGVAAIATQAVAVATAILLGPAAPAKDHR
jgi:hypothetical protein